MTPVRGRDHGTRVELARRLCAAYVSFRMRRRGIDAVFLHLPRRIGDFWTELASLVMLQRRRSALDANDEMLKNTYNARDTFELSDEGDHASVKIRAKRSVRKKLPHAEEKRPT
jgi:hypothetical protein